MTAGPAVRLPRAARRAQILDAATRAFARSGYSATSLDDVAAEAGITRVLLYRHFESKADMYRSVLERAGQRITAMVGIGEDLRPEAVAALLQAAAADPDAFRLLFRHAAREPEFREYIDTLTAESTEIAQSNLARLIPPGPWLDWAAKVVPALTTEAVIAWLDAGRPAPEQAALRIGLAIDGVVTAARTALPPGAVCPAVPPVPD
ncbi:TetR/AcrR family transcriptional regulator [Yinghuangia soli]|uniref:TetR/AcrR family transcriptional regulator n=1 Tax=Yinghuangia soli TaxID=2908204 RepID=A0AA41Q4A0_9ACTN|nr:TetR family transcriptional regulator [Yinghuangia soli]MCF2531280.1 TetR/AcrR family transcriptional regulator [Yinghuangia soli]